MKDLNPAFYHFLSISILLQPFPLNITHSLLGIYHHRVHGEHREKIENEKSLSIFKKILCLVFPIPLSLRSVFSVVKILAGTADPSHRSH